MRRDGRARLRLRLRPLSAGRLSCPWLTRRLLVICTAAVPTGCAESSARSWVTTVDTLPGGTVVVVNAPRGEDAAPAAMLEEDLRIGSANDSGPALFGQIKALEVLPDGRIVVLESQAQEIRVFAPDGNHHATYGRRGAGPGEFENAFGLMLSSDGLLYVPDQRNARVAVLHPDSGVVRTHPLRLYRYGFVWDGAMRSDDHIVVPSISLETRRDLFRIYDPTINLVDTILPPPTPPVNQDDPPGSFAWQAPGGMPRGFARVPFYSTGAAHIDRAGMIWAAFPGDPAYRLARRTLDGDTVMLLETRRPPIPVTRAERDSALDGILQSLRQYGVTRLDESKVPAVKAAVLALFTDDQERLWVQTSSPDALRRYDVYARDGRLLSSVATALHIVAYVKPVVRGGYFHAVVTDELDVPWVVRARVPDM